MLKNIAPDEVAFFRATVELIDPIGEERGSPIADEIAYVMDEIRVPHGRCILPVIAQRKGAGLC
ncbi:MAG: hypothetical protein JO266_12875 [Acidobacteria bacterium]|nr:hypothetical protein [Acidobacteriota bacterium]MBV8892840.1 hypothetical protein [Acidobacteriota bacterium]